MIEKAPSGFPRLRLSSSSSDWALCYPDNELGDPVNSWTEAPTQAATAEQAGPFL